MKYLKTDNKKLINSKFVLIKLTMTNETNTTKSNNLFSKPTIRIVNIKSLKSVFKLNNNALFNTSPEPLYNHSCNVFLKNKRIWGNKQPHIPSAIGAYLISVNTDNPNCKIFTIWMETWAGHSYKLDVIPKTQKNIPNNSNTPIMIGTSYMFSDEFLEDNTVFIHLANKNIKIKFESNIETTAFFNDMVNILCDGISI